MVFQGIRAINAQPAARCASKTQPWSVKARPYSPVRVSTTISASSVVFVKRRSIVFQVIMRPNSSQTINT